MTTQLAERVRQTELALAAIEERFAAQEKALGLVEKELARRLDQLNHEQARISLRDSLFMQKETWEARIVSLEAFKNNAIGRNATLTVVISVSIGLLSMAVSLAVSLFR